MVAKPRVCRLSLPLPTSLNKLYINQFSGGRATGKKILSKEGKHNREDIILNVERQMTMEDNLDWDIEYTKNNYIFMDIDAYVTRVNVDLDNTLKNLNDSIEASQLVFYNDKKVIPRFNRVYIDPSNPRVELTITQTGWIGIFDDSDDYTSFETKCFDCSRYRNGACSVLKKVKENKLIEEIVHVEGKYTCQSFKEKK